MQLRQSFWQVGVTPGASAPPRGRTKADDLALVERVVGGCPDAVDAFVARMFCISRFVGALNRRARLSASSLEDVAQEVFGRVWGQLSQYRGDSKLESWVFGFTKRTMNDFIRLEVRRRRESGSHPDAAAWLAVVPARTSADSSAASHEARLLKVVQRLPTDLRSLVLARALDGTSFADIAERFSVSAAVVKRRYYRALEAMRTGEVESQRG